MKHGAEYSEIHGILRQSGHQRVFLGQALASTLCAQSFTDVLNEDTGTGYQRPFNARHSRDFRAYIQRPDSSTVPLVFNLRRELSAFWEVRESGSGLATLAMRVGCRCLAQVDCQHRLGELEDCSIPLVFMTFINLDLRSEMALFYVINSKARGLSSSLTDYHQSNLIDDIRREAPHLFIARRLNEDPDSPWFQMIRYGGERTSGIKRRASLRMMQKSVMRLLRILGDDGSSDIDVLYNVFCSYWNAVKRLFPDEWLDHRRHLLTKGLGLYSLTMLFGVVAKERDYEALTEDWFFERLMPLCGHVDWGTHGEFAGLGGQKGVQVVFEKLKETLIK